MVAVVAAVATRYVRDRPYILPVGLACDRGIFDRLYVTP